MISKIESQYTVPSVKNFLRYIFALDLDWELKQLTGTQRT
ncbi:hypothetical protein ABMB44_13925 [Levilactobacillus brevis]